MHRNTIFLIALALILFGVFVRLVPHFPNATPITAIAFVGSMYLGRRWSVMLPLVALLLSDALIGWYDWRIMASVYGSFALIGVVSWICRKYKDAFSITLSLVGAALLFFFVTNTAVWFFSPWYEKSIAGLLYSYELGLPFLRNMFVGDIVYTSALVGVFAFFRAAARLRQSDFATP
jgi:hypothetical protein